MSKSLNNIRTAIVYDRVNKWGGAERVLEVLHEIFPDAPLYTSVYDKDKAKWANVYPDVKTSFLQSVKYFRTHHELIPWLMPLAFESMNVKDYDLVISVASEYCKGVITQPNTLHICYCLTPTRYLWSGNSIYFDGFFNRTITKPVVKYLQKYDLISSKRPDKLIAISTEVKERIKKYYGIDANIVFPPVNKPAKARLSKKRSYYLIVSRLVKYKRVDIAINAFNKLNRTLLIVGEGNEFKRLSRMAKPNIKFVGKVNDRKLAQLYASSKALIMPQEEDFGLVSIEAQMYGTPVISLRKGGALDTILDKKTGLFFDNQNEGDLMKTIDKFEKMTFDIGIIQKNAQQYRKERFKKDILDIIKKEL